MTTTATSIIRQSCGFSAMQSCGLFPPPQSPTTCLAGTKRCRSDSFTVSSLSASSSSKRTATPKATVQRKAITAKPITSTPPATGEPQQPQETENPVDYLKALFSGNATTKAWMKQEEERNADYGFSKPTPEQLANYDWSVVKAVRERNIIRVREMLADGKQFNACNRFGESLIHMACRRGDKDMIEFLLEDANVNVDVCDDFGRRPLHDALWTSQPNPEVIQLLLTKMPPSMLLVEDVRGHTPFHYSRREHWPIWVAFLKENAALILQRASMVQTVPVVMDHK